MIRRPPRSTLSSSSAASDVYKRQQVVLYAWPPPGQSVAPLCQTDFLHYLILIGEAGGGATGARQDWETLPHKVSPALSRYGRGRTGSLGHRVTVFYGGGQPY